MQKQTTMQVQTITSKLKFTSIYLGTKLLINYQPITITIDLDLDLQFSLN